MNVPPNPVGRRISYPLGFYFNQNFRLAILTNFNCTTNRFARKTLGMLNPAQRAITIFRPCFILTRPRGTSEKISRPLVLPAGPGSNPFGFGPISEPDS